MKAIQRCPCWRWSIVGFALLSPAVGRAADVPADSLEMRISPLTTDRFHTSWQTTADWVRWLSERRQFTYRGVPYGLTGLPVVYFNTNSEWNRGVRVKWTDYSRPPFRYKAVLNWTQSTGGRLNLFLGLRVPSLAATRWGLQFQFDVTQGLRQYYGLGNDTQVDHRLTDPRSPLFKDENYYSYRLRKPRLFFSLLRQVRGPVVAAAGFGIKWATISRPGAASLLFDEQSYGLPGGTTGLVSLVLRWDTRDDETIPRRGTLHEWSYELSHGSPVDEHLFNAIAFHRFTFTDLRYAALSDRLYLANRVVFEVLQGKPPIDVYGDIGGIRRRVGGLGGDETLRGFSPYRFMDKVRSYANTELRCRFHRQRFLRQYLEWNGVAFVDLGRVWPDLDSLTLKGTHLSGGGGVRLYWNEDFVIRLETAISSEQTFTGIQLGNVF